MSDSVAAMQRQLEIYINTQASDLTVFRTTLQCMFLVMLGNHPNKDEMFSGLANMVRGSLTNTVPLEGQSPEDAKRVKEFTLMRAEQFFNEMATALGISLPSTQSGAKN